MAQSGSVPTSWVSNDPPEWPAIEALLAQPPHHPQQPRPLMREVPRLSVESEARVIRLYQQTNRLAPKRNLVRILAFGGGQASAALLRQTVTEEFSGQCVEGYETVLLEYIPTLCGVLARHTRVWG